jgi:2-polyprenyl-3-methyl-5-hydroxy-6-metoxy-1,4-benzoquinol methylase
MSETFDQAAYWKERHRKLRGDHRATGNISRSPEQMLQRKIVQAYFYSTLVNALMAERRDPRSWRAGSSGTTEEVLDIGFGTGFLGSLLTLQGISYTGYDLSEVAVEDAAAMCPQAAYKLHNIVETPAQPSDVIIVSEVLFHIVDDAQWMSALKNIAAGLRPNGVFFFTETFVPQIQPGPAHFKARTRAMYVEALERHGMRFVRPDELKLAAMPVLKQYDPFKLSVHFVRLMA